jgi:hypothetical protein
MEGLRTTTLKAFWLSAVTLAVVCFYSAVAVTDPVDGKYNSCIVPRKEKKLELQANVIQLPG